MGEIFQLKKSFCKYQARFHQDHPWMRQLEGEDLMRKRLHVSPRRLLIRYKPGGHQLSVRKLGRRQRQGFPQTRPRVGQRYAPCLPMGRTITYVLFPLRRRHLKSQDAATTHVLKPRAIPQNDLEGQHPSKLSGHQRQRLKKCPRCKTPRRPHS